jgi:hypothetical protein
VNKLTPSIYVGVEENEISEEERDERIRRGKKKGHP